MIETISLRKAEEVQLQQQNLLTAMWTLYYTRPLQSKKEKRVSLASWLGERRNLNERRVVKTKQDEIKEAERAFNAVRNSFRRNLN